MPDLQDLEFQGTRVRPLIQIAAKLVRENPKLAENYDYLWAQMCHVVPDLLDRSKCAGCGRSQKISNYEADLLDGLLILCMARQVREQLYKGVPFTEANKIHLPTLPTTQGILKRSTKCDYLGLIKQPEAWRGSGYWVLTSWAWKALRGEPIPRVAQYWEGQLLGRSQEMTTLDQMFKTHNDLVTLALEKRAAIKADHRAKFADYNPADWGKLSDEGITFDQANP